MAKVSLKLSKESIEQLLNGESLTFNVNNPNNSPVDQVFISSDGDATYLSPNAYQKECLRTLPKLQTRGEEMLHGLIGLGGEAGECLDLYKKVLYHNHPMDYTHLQKELGDVLWYVAVTAHAMDCDLEKIMQMNIEKLWARYPDGFSVDKSINRAEGDI